MTYGGYYSLDIKYLDYKVTLNMFKDDESYNCIDKFLTNTQPKKLDKDDKNIEESSALGSLGLKPKPAV